MAALPQELMEEILSRLPVKSLLGFKTTSKKWYSLISQNHDFSKLHLKQTSASNSLIFYQLNANGDIFQYSDIDTYKSHTIKFPVEITKPCRLIGSANGLICVASWYNDNCCYIWNPCTCDFKRISVPITPAGESLFGFGYDSISDDYKVLGYWDSHLRIFSLKSNSWKMLESSWIYPFAIKALHSNGALHWCFGPQITAFDLADEKILLLDLPEGSNFVGSYNSSWNLLFDYQGSLCASGRNSVWVMKEYGNSSWAKLGTSLHEEYAKPVSISRFGELVFRGKAGVAFVESDKQGRMSDEDMSQVRRYADGFEYTESLISTKCFDPKRFIN